MRSALEKIWDLNIKAFPSAMVWAVSFWFIIESSSLLIRLGALLTANLAVIYSGLILAKRERPRSGVTLLHALQDRFVWKALLPISFILGLALQNVRHQESTTIFAKYFYSSIVLSSLILWLFALVVLIPARAYLGFQGEEITVLSLGMKIISGHKGALGLSLSILLFTWPLFFIYIFLALTLAQSIILSKIEEGMRVNLA